MLGNVPQRREFVGHSAELTTFERAVAGATGSAVGAPRRRGRGPRQVDTGGRGGATSRRDIALGVATTWPSADIRLAGVVLDIGCGGGTDTVLAAHATGPGGKVYALDFLPEMLERTRKASEEAGVDGVVETIEGEVEGHPAPRCQRRRHRLQRGDQPVAPEVPGLRRVRPGVRAGGRFCAPGHDARVVGDEPYVGLDFTGAADYTSDETRPVPGKQRAGGRD